MRYKLYKDVIPSLSATQQILYNRGIEIENQEQWLNAENDEIYPWELLGKDKMRKAAIILRGHIEAEDDIVIVVDCDCDGYTSAALLINFLYDYVPQYVEEHVSWIHHKGKEHGLKDVVQQIVDAEKYSLVICPDSASNDLEEHKRLEQYGIDCIVLDHHEYSAEIEETSPAIIINVQGAPDYPNKALTGAGVVYKFVDCCFDEWKEAHDIGQYLDICALGNCGDMADYREIEIRALINLGFKHIRNPFFRAMSKKNEYSIDKMNGINYLSIAFYVVPFINAVVRSGTMEEKQLVFESFLKHRAFEKVPSSKRGHKGEEVYLYDEAVLVAERVKRRQTKLQDESLALLEKRIKDDNMLDNAMLIFTCEPGEVEKNIAGLIANKLQAKYQRPTAILTRSKTINDKEVFYRGSMRNYSLSEITDLKSVLENTDDVEWVQGHANAAGMSVAEKELDNLNKDLNEIYKDIDQRPTYWVDYIWNSRTFEPNKILEIGDEKIYGQNIPESLVCIEDICLRPEMITLMSADKNPTLKIDVNGLSIIKFKSSQEEYEEFCGENKVLTVIAKCNVNEWNGRISPQLLVEDFDLREEWIF